MKTLYGSGGIPACLYLNTQDLSGSDPSYTSGGGVGEEGFRDKTSNIMKPGIHYYYYIIINKIAYCIARRDTERHGVALN